MSIFDLVTRNSDPQKYGRTPPEPSASASNRPLMDEATAGLMGVLPRGVPLNRRVNDREEMAHWAHPKAIEGLSMGERHAPGQLPRLPIGTFNGRLIGYNDDRLTITIAGARAGKTSTILIPELLTYPGSVFCNDPKGELVQTTARHRAECLGQNVVVLDPFKITGLESGHYNPLDEMDLLSQRVIDDAFSLAQAIVVADGDSGGQFWTEGGRELLAGVILSVLELPEEHRHLVTVRQMLTGSHPALRAEAAQRQFKSDAARAEFMENLLLTEMAKATKANSAMPQAVADVITGIGEMYSTMPTRTRGSMLATARVATRFLDSLGMREIITRSDFRMRELRDAAPAFTGTTVYLVLPPGNEMKAHYRWLRTMFEMASSRLMRMGVYPRDKAPVLFLMEEFPVLGYLETIEQAAAFLPGYGVKLHIVAQSLVQLQDNYPTAWHTFFNCAGLTNFFANTDRITLNYLSERLGRTTFDRDKAQFSNKNEDNRVTLNLLSPFEIERYFARDYNNQIVLIPGHAPYAVQRLEHRDVEQLRLNMQAGRMAIDVQPVEALPALDVPKVKEEVRRNRSRPPENRG